MSKYIIQYKQGCDTITEGLGISQERTDELTYRIELIIHELFRPTKTGVIEVNSETIFKQFLSLAENHAEAIWLAFAAGMHTEGLIPGDEDFEEDEE